MQEIERKFLIVDDSYRALAYDKSEILQGYICSGHGHTVREKEITLQDARDLFTLCRFGRIEKTRYLIRNGKHTVEVDEFHGDNEGLVFAEIELSDVDEAFICPPFLGDEVTGNPRYYNAYISKHPYSTWEVE